MILSALLFAAMGACFKAAMPAASMWQAVFFRTGVSLPLILLLSGSRGLPFVTARPFKLVSRSIAGFAALSLSVYALSRIPLGNVSVLFATSPVFIALLSGPLVHEQVSRRIYLLLPFFLAGVALIVKPEISFDSIPSLAALMGGFLSAIAQLYVRDLSKTEKTITIVLYFTALSAILSLPLALLSWRPLSPAVAGLLVLSGLLATAGQLAMTRAYQLEAAHVVGVFGYFNPLASYLLGVMLFGEAPDLYSVVGALLILLCGYVAGTRRRLPIQA